MSKSDPPYRLSPIRRGTISGPLAAFIVSVLLLIALVGLLWWGGDDRAGRTSQPPLLVYCAGGLKEPLEAIRADYQRDTGQSLQLQYGGSNTLLTNLGITHQGDVFLPADESYIDLAVRDGLVRRTVPIVGMRPIVAVRKGNPLGIHALDDLVFGRARISMTEPDAAATGKLVRDALTKSGHWEAFRQHVTVFKPTVNDVASDLKLGAVDAAVIWDAMLVAYPDFEKVSLAELSATQARVVAGVATASARPEAALEFIHYLAAPGRGQVHFQKNGFLPLATTAAGASAASAQERP
jgi:molybdate transport system substrate-binding protein